MGKADRVSGAFWFFFSAFVCYLSYKLGLGSLHEPGPGFFFFWTGIVMAILSLTVIVRSLQKQSRERTEASIFTKGTGLKVSLVLFSLFLYALLIEWLGFLIVTLLLFFFLLAVIEKKRFSFAVLISLIVTGLSYLVFELGLQSQLPKGILQFLRF